MTSSIRTDRSRMSRIRTVALVSMTAVATAVAINILPITAQKSAPDGATSAAVAGQVGTGAPLVSGLPDFTRLVDQVGPAVVNIEATSDGRRRVAGRSEGPGGLDQDQIPEFFRRFFGPGGPGPMMPDAPDAPDGGPRGVSQGSGFLISADGYVLTNHHVIDGADAVKVTLSDRREFTAEVIGSDQPSDVAVLKIDAKALPYLRTGDSRTLKPGQWVVAIGSPFGLEHSVTAGIVSAVGRVNPYSSEQRYVPFIQTDVAINRGNSGGPLLNTRGEVVGINSQIFSNSGGYMGVSFAIPMDVAMNVTDQLRSSGQVQRGQLGAVVGPVDGEAAKGFGLPDTRGALVNDVAPGSGAEKAGIEPGDVIRRVDGQPIVAFSDLPPMIGAKAPGSTVEIELLRAGKPVNKRVTLTRLEDGSARTAPERPRPQNAAAPGRASNVLGLVAADLSATERERLGLRGAEGVRVDRVDAGPARSAGVRPGDVVLRVGTRPVSSASDLDRALSGVGKDDTVMLLIRRGGANRFLAVGPESERG